MDEPDVHEVVGYVVCVGCRDALVLDVTARRTGDLCVDCLAERGEPLRHIEVEARGARLPIPLRATRPKRSHRTSTPESRARERLVDKCKDRARKRLAAIFPDLYDVLLAEERAAVGLDPWSIDRALRAADDPDGNQTVEFAALYHALEEQGVDV